MTGQQLYFFSALYLIVFAGTVILTRPSLRRVAGVIAGALAAGAAGILVVVLGEGVGWWHFAMTWEGYSWVPIGLG